MLDQQNESSETAKDSQFRDHFTQLVFNIHFGSENPSWIMNDKFLQSVMVQ